MIFASAVDTSPPPPWCTGREDFPVAVSSFCSLSLCRLLRRGHCAVCRAQGTVCHAQVSSFRARGSACHAHGYVWSCPAMGVACSGVFVSCLGDCLSRSGVYLSCSGLFLSHPGLCRTQVPVAPRSLARGSRLRLLNHQFSPPPLPPPPPPPPPCRCCCRFELWPVGWASLVVTAVHTCVTAPLCAVALW